MLIAVSSGATIVSIKSKKEKAKNSWIKGNSITLAYFGEILNVR